MAFLNLPALSLVGFAAAAFTAAVIPGPAITALIARVLREGTRGSTGIVIGMMVADSIWVGLVVFGLSAVATSYPQAFEILTMIGAGYLLYMGVRIFRTKPIPPSPNADNQPHQSRQSGVSDQSGASDQAGLSDQPTGSRSEHSGQTLSSGDQENLPQLFLMGFLLNFANPKVIMFYIAMLPAFFDLAKLGLYDVAAILVAVILVLLVVLYGYIFMADRARVYLQAPEIQRWISRIAGCVIIAAALSILFPLIS